MTRVKHRLSGEEMTVIKVSGEVAICRIDKPEKVMFHLYNDKAVCDVSNLLPVNMPLKQLNLL